MTNPSIHRPAHPPGSEPAGKWFCLHTQPKREHFVAGQLQKELRLEVCLPRIRFRRATREGPVWFTEALFPGYLFARFELGSVLRQVHHARGVRGVVHFGNQWPAVPDAVIEQLRSAVGASQVHVIENDLQPGDAVVVAGGAFHDLRAVVTRVVPARQRVAVLLSFLGRQTAVELAQSAVVRCADARQELVGEWSDGVVE